MYVGPRALCAELAGAALRPAAKPSLCSWVPQYRGKELDQSSWQRHPRLFKSSEWIIFKAEGCVASYTSRKIKPSVLKHAGAFQKPRRHSQRFSVSIDFRRTQHVRNLALLLMANSRALRLRVWGASDFCVHRTPAECSSVDKFIIKVRSCNVC